MSEVPCLVHSVSVYGPRPFGLLACGLFEVKLTIAFIGALAGSTMYAALNVRKLKNGVQGANRVN